MMSYAVVALQSAMSVLGIRGVYEQPKYEVLAKFPGEVEVRRYEPRLAAEVTVSAANADAGRNEAFQLLAGYIFGANRPAASADGGRKGKAGEKIAMTAPVQTTAAKSGEKIAMTSPVQTAATRPVSGGEGEGYTMRFFLPSRLTAASAPRPTDERVRIVTVETETVAALRFSGAWRDEMLANKQAALLRGLEGSPWRTAGPAFTLFYDPPFTPPMLRRNEVAVPVEPRDPG